MFETLKAKWAAAGATTKAVVMAVCSFVGYQGYEKLNHPPQVGQPTPQGMVAYAPAANAAPATVAGERKTVSFKVAGAGRTTTLSFLNDKADYRAADCFTVVVPRSMLEDPRALVGKTITATGVMCTYRGRPQLKVSAASDLQISN